MGFVSILHFYSLTPKHHFSKGSHIACPPLSVLTESKQNDCKQSLLLKATHNIKNKRYVKIAFVEGNLYKSSYFVL